jgi:hypothetical protein
MDQNLTHRIRERAYEIWLANGCRHGEADQHWLTAEREVIQAEAAAKPEKARSSRRRAVRRGAPHEKSYLAL